MTNPLRWATTLANRVEPPDAKKAAGFVPQRPESAQYLNWMFGGLVDSVELMAHAFRVVPRKPADMQVRVLRANLMSHNGPVEVAEQASGAITAPVVNPKIVRVGVSKADGSVVVVNGAEAASPTAPDYPAGVWPGAQIYLTTSHTEIVLSDITDERVVGIGGMHMDVFHAGESGTWSPDSTVDAVLAILVGGGGGGGGGSGALWFGDNGWPGGGGGGGSGGAHIMGLLNVSGSIAYSVGAGGTGGTGGTGTTVGADTAGTVGASGGDTVFGEVTAPGGVGGSPGPHHVSGIAGNGGAGGDCITVDNDPATAGTTTSGTGGAAGAGTASPSFKSGAGGGGGGGGDGVPNAGGAGGDGGTSMALGAPTTAPAQGGATTTADTGQGGAAGESGPRVSDGGAGGAGGADKSTAGATAGSAAVDAAQFGAGGGGGGGGGASSSTTPEAPNGGDGANGGQGLLVLIY